MSRQRSYRQKHVRRRGGLYAAAASIWVAENGERERERERKVWVG